MTKNLNDYEEGFKNFCKENSTAINRIYPIGKIYDPKVLESLKR